MNKILATLVLLSITCSATAKTLVHNINGYTMNEGTKVRFVALEFDRGRITHLYETQQEITSSEADTKIDGKGATLLPGLIDAHGHVGNHGLLLQSVNLIGSTSEAQATQ